MTWFKNTQDGYISFLSTECGQIEITQQEYDDILSLIRNHPSAPAGYAYRLTVDLTWELYELPPAPPAPEEDAEPEDYEDALRELGVDV